MIEKASKAGISLGNSLLYPKGIIPVFCLNFGTVFEGIVFFSAPGKAPSCNRYFLLQLNNQPKMIMIGSGSKRMCRMFPMGISFYG